ncbi:verprolin-like isoform X2 [Notothenia coriiceps]|uniref:Verprolin-like isoform X2 n=1 Tax=Notothenia coriiceps TaxID=8208 RepID=A0A6I9N8D4_9TELE|nr:PREDICTED: verprolin-like isoform X2 [Notothenia coriiceps]
MCVPLIYSYVALCRRATTPQSSAHGKNGMESSKLSGSVLHVSASEDLHKSMEALQTPPVVLQRGGAEGDGAVSLKNEDDTNVSRRQTEESIEFFMRVGEDISDREMSWSSRGGIQEAPPSPQFCSKHQRWVESILQQCPEELQDNVSLSPLLFQSPSSNTTSQDFTPSGLIPSPFDQPLPPSETFTHLQTASQPANLEQSSAAPGSSADPVLLPSPRDTQLPPHLTPVVRLLDIASVRRFCHFSKPHQAPFHPSALSPNKQDACCSSLQVPTSPRCRTSGNNASAGGATQDSPLVQHAPQNTTHQVFTAPGSQHASTSTSCQPPIEQYFSKLSRKYRWPCVNSRVSPVLDKLNQNTCPTVPELSVPRPPTEEASTAASPSSTSSSQPVVPQNSFKPPAQNTIHLQPSYSTVSPPPPEAPLVLVESGRVRRDGLRLSMHSQAVLLQSRLLQSRLLQPCVPLSRLSAQECYRMTGWRSSSRGSEPGVQGRNDDNGRKEEEEEEDEGSFDPNSLYSSYSSSSADDSMDPDYKPCLKKRRLLLEYETARTMGHT